MAGTRSGRRSEIGLGRRIGRDCDINGGDARPPHSPTSVEPTSAAVEGR